MSCCSSSVRGRSQVESVVILIMVESSFGKSPGRDRAQDVLL